MSEHSDGPERPDTDALEDTLRRLFTDDRLAIPAAPAATARVMAAARRARRRRELTMVGGGTLAAASLLVGVVLVAMPTGNGGLPVAAPPLEPTSSQVAVSESAELSKAPAEPPQQPSSDKRSVGSSLPSRGSSQPTERAADPSEEFNAPMVAGGPVGPSGYAKLTLGMSFEDAKPHLADASEPPSGCTHYSLAEGSEYVSTVAFSAAGLARITATGGRTPENLGTGSTVEELQAAYPDGQIVEDGAGYEAPAADGAIYQFPLADGAATGLSLSNGGEC